MIVETPDPWLSAAAARTPTAAQIECLQEQLAESLERIESTRGTIEETDLRPAGRWPRQGAG